ncbi:50S ribosomal protein L13 [Candidatus Azambacteria bacterium]|nr:50S ribosomal protein L13 [Candidatus Azambacteria bacterium]
MKEYNFNASDYVLGRLASEVAYILAGKNEPSYERHIPSSNVIKIINCGQIKVTGNKLKDKIYFHHSGYLGGMKKTLLGELLKKDSREVLRKAIYGMLPKNRLRAGLMKNLILEK